MKPTTPVSRLLPGVLTLCVTTAAWVLCPPAFAAKKDNYDALQDLPKRAGVQSLAGVDRERLIARDAEIRVDQRFDVPTFLPTVPRPASAAAAALATAEARARAAARDHLAAYAPFYGLDPSDVRDAVAGPVHDTGRGAVIVSFTQRIDGIDVFRDEIRVAMDRGHSLVALAGFLTGTGAAAAGRPFPFVIDAEEAIAFALHDLAGISVASGALTTGPRTEGGYRLYTIDEATQSAVGMDVAPARARKVLFHLPDAYEPAWYIEVSAGGSGQTESDAYAYVISATDGRLLFRSDLTVSDAFSYRVWADPGGANTPTDGPQGNAPTPHPTGVPDGSQAAFTAPVIVTLQNGPISTNDPWLLPTATATQGNNVDAYADLSSPDGFGPGDFRASTTGTRTFDRVYDTAQGPQASQTQQMASVTQLFYVNNFLHDWFYDSGFNEASRNAQQNNYGRGGIAGDPIRAEAQDYNGRNNANMTTPADGGRPRMQMYVFDGNGLNVVTVNSPAAIAGPYASGVAAFGPQTFGVTGDVILANDGVGTATDGCETLLNGGAINGRIALIDRGNCNFTVKVKNAQTVGALAVIIANNTSGVLTMGGTDGSIMIGSLLISQADGLALKGHLGGGVNATLTREAALDRDGTIDNQIVAHEWGHYISNRLVGNGSGLSTAMGGALGEGWGDFHALLMSVRPEDALAPAGPSFSGAYGLAGYVMSGGANQGYYFGIRRVPYSTDFSRNPLTFRHIANGNPLPTTAPIAFGADGSNNAEVHNAGEIWASMLWECYAALLRDTLGTAPRLTFAQAQTRMTDYLVAAYKLTPSSPTLLEARDALVVAAGANDPVDRALFQQAFARRGAGLGAVAPDRYSTTHVGVVESFVPADDLVLDDAALDDSVSTVCPADGTLDNGEVGRLTITLRNTGSSALTSTTATVSTTHPGVTFPAGDTILFPLAPAGGTATAFAEVALSGAVGVEAAEFSVAYDDPGLLTPGTRIATIAARVNADELPATSAIDDVESVATAWTPANDPSLDVSQPWRRVEVSALEHHWLGPDTGTSSDQYLVSPPLEVASTGSFSFTFSHRHSFESSGGIDYDGGVIEISSDGGSTWFDVGAAASPGYTGVLDVGGLNPIEGRSAYTGLSAGYPAFIPVTVSLGTGYQGQTVRVRFRIGTDIGVGAPGWEIDNIAFGNLANLPFGSVVPGGTACDGDSDGVADPSDCAPADGSLWSPPSEAIDLTLVGEAPTLLDWSGPALPGGTAPIIYDVLRSDAAGDFATAACLATGSSSAAASDADIPSAGAYFYLIRSRNDCGESMGTTSSGSTRSGIVCP